MRTRCFFYGIALFTVCLLGAHVAFAAALTVSSTGATNTTSTSTIMHGSVDDTGGLNVYERGFQYGLDTTYGNTVETSIASTTSYGTGAFTSTVNLACNTTYHFMAFVYASNGMSTTTFASTTSTDQTLTTGNTDPSCGKVTYAYNNNNPVAPHTIAYNGQIYTYGNYSGSETAIFQTQGGDTITASGGTTVKTTGSNPDYSQQVFNYGQSDNYTIKTQYSTPDSQTLKVDLYVTNNSVNDTLKSLEIHFNSLYLVMPGKTYTDYKDGIGEFQGPNSVWSGNWGSVAMFSDNYANNSNLSDVWIPAGQSSWFTYQNYSNAGGSSLNNLYDSIAPGQTYHYDYYIRFGSSTATRMDLAPESYTAWRTAFPYLINWPNRAPVARWFLTNGTGKDSSLNPRGYLANSTLDVSNQTNFNAQLTAAASTTIATMNAMWPKPQAIDIWDLEGQEFNQSFTYVGNPNKLATIAPEMDAAADALVNQFRNAGYPVALTLRPSNFGAGPILPSTCYHDPSTSNGGNQDSDVYIWTTASFPYRAYVCTATNTWTQQGAYTPGHQTGSELDSVLLSNLEGKVSYARTRWGVHMFYVDSTVYGDGQGGFNYQIFRQLQTDFPDCIFFPENIGAGPASGAAVVYSAPGDANSSPLVSSSALSLYPNAFLIYQPVDSGQVNLASTSPNFNTLVQSIKQGNLMYFDGWFQSGQNAQLGAIYQAAGYTPAPLVSITVPAAFSTVFGTLTLTATSTYYLNSGVQGVQFKIDGANIGSMVTATSGPDMYTMSWDTTGASNGLHSISAVSSDYIGNSTTTTIDVIVSNDSSAVIPTLSQASISSITASSSVASSTMTSTGGAIAGFTGFAYGTDPTFTASTATTSQAGSFDIGAFNATLSNLSCNTTYYVRPYAENSAGTAFGASQSFTTNACLPPSAPTNVSAYAGNANATISFAIPTSNGGSPILYYFASSTPDNDIATSTVSPIVVNGLTNNTSYTFQIYAVNAAGTSSVSVASNSVTPAVPIVYSSPTVIVSSSYPITATSSTLNGSISDDGNASTTLVGFNFGLDTSYGGFTTEHFPSDTGPFSITITGLTCETLYHYQAYALNAAHWTGLSGDQTFTTGACSVPTISVASASSISQTSATINGNLTISDGANATAEGFEYGTDTNYGTVVSFAGYYPTGAFNQSLTGLTCGSTYHYRSFATNSAGTASSTDQSFTTSACPSSGGGGGGGIFGGGGGGGGSIPASELASLLSTSTASASSVSTATTSTCPFGWTCMPVAVNADLTQNLAVGSTGPQVTLLQTILAGFGLFNGPTSGYFGPLTEQAVKDYQTSQGISPVGAVGPITLAALNRGGRSRVSSQSSAPAVVAVPAASSTAFTRNLYMGLNGSDVVLLQKTLNKLGFEVAATGPGSSGNETSIFGPATQSALQKYQCYANIVCSGAPGTTGYGVLGLKTRLAIVVQTPLTTPLPPTTNTRKTTTSTTTPTIIAPAPKVVATTTTVSTKTSTSAVPVATSAVTTTVQTKTAALPPFTDPLRIGSTGQEVKNLQIFLNTHGFIIASSGAESPGHETTAYDELTANAVSQFQEANAAVILAPYGLSRGTGTFGGATISVANSIINQ